MLMTITDSRVVYIAIQWHQGSNRSLRIMPIILCKVTLGEMLYIKGPFLNPFSILFKQPKWSLPNYLFSLHWVYYLLLLLLSKDGHWLPPPKALHFSMLSASLLIVIPLTDLSNMLTRPLLLRRVWSILKTIKPSSRPTILLLQLLEDSLFAWCQLPPIIQVSSSLI